MTSNKWCQKRLSLVLIMVSLVLSKTQASYIFFSQVKVNHFSSVSKWHIVAVVNHIFSYMNTLKLLFNFIILNHIVQITNIMFCDSILLQDDILKKNTQTCHGLKCVTCLEVNLPFYNLTELK